MLTALLMLFCMSANAQKSVKGDVNGDGIVNNADIEEVVKIITGDSDNEKGDITEDKFVNVADIVAIVNIMIEQAKPKPNPVITFSVNITNNTGADVTLDGGVAFVLGNPDHNEFFLGWDGPFNNTPVLTFCESSVTLKDGETRKFEGVSWHDEESDMGMGEKSPLDPKLFGVAGNPPRNVMVSVDGKLDVVLCENMDPSIIFKEGETYSINLEPSGGQVGPGPVDPSVGNPVITIGVNIINNTGQVVTLDGDLYFVLGNPDHNGRYMGWNGAYNKTGHIYFSSSAVSFGVGETKSFGGLTWNDEGNGLGEKSPMNPILLAGTDYHHNVAVYVGRTGEVVYCENMDPNIVFTDGGVYNIVLSYVGAAPAPTPTPGGNPVISINVRITNAHGSPVILDGDLKFTLGNPDKRGNYFGWGGPYNGTDHIYFYPYSVSLGAGETRVFNGVTWRDKDTGMGLGGKSPADAGQLAAADRPRNVLLYVGGNSTVVLCDNMDPNIVFEEGGTYDIVIR